AGGVYNLPHGALTASLLAPVMAYNYMGEPEKYARIAQAMGENIWGLTVWEAAELAVDAVARLTQDLDIPTLAEMAIPEDDIPMLAQLAYDDPQTIGNPRDIDVAGYEMIYRSCFA
ncbi:MAG: iron-containing alcohol dehydrogenase, partial [Anaerolineae bacterium]